MGSAEPLGEDSSNSQGVARQVELVH
jgi:hypothetical protein